MCYYSKVVRLFQEYDVQKTGKTKLVARGDFVSLTLALPNDRDWLSFAAMDEIMMSGPRILSAGSQGFLPGELRIDRRTETGIFEMISIPFEVVGRSNYALLFYEGVDNRHFVQSVERFLLSCPAQGQVGRGNHLMISETDESGRAMLLLPVWMIIGEREYLGTAWSDAVRATSPMALAVVC